MSSEIDYLTALHKMAQYIRTVEFREKKTPSLVSSTICLSVLFNKTPASVYHDLSSEIQNLPTKEYFVAIGEE